MAKVTAANRDIRRNFGKMPECLQIPHLLQMQHNSYEEFLQKDVPPEKRKDIGLQNALKSAFPIISRAENVVIEFVEYSLNDTPFNPAECKQRGKTYAASIHVVVRMIVYDKKTAKKPMEKRTPIEVKEQKVYFGSLPLMTAQGTFIINGTERVVVSQLHRSPGVFFSHDKGKTHSSGKLLYKARIIPHRGAWLDFEFDTNDKIHVRIDRRSKLPVTVLLHALGISDQGILERFFKYDEFKCTGKGDYQMRFHTEKEESSRWVGMVLDFDIKMKTVKIPAGTRITWRDFDAMRKTNLKWITIPRKSRNELLLDRTLAKDIIDAEGEVIVKANELLTAELLDSLEAAGIKQLTTIFINDIDHGPYISATLRDDKEKGTFEAQTGIYKVMRPGEPAPTPKAAEDYFASLFQNDDRYELSACGRMKFNRAVGHHSDTGSDTLSKDDILDVLELLVALRNGKHSADDIDHLGNRRVRSVGELTKNAIQSGLARINRAVTERLGQPESEKQAPGELISPKPITATLRDFFAGSQMSQFMDQINPLSEVTHKRRISALGPGGLMRERAGFEVRDVHFTHYGRICPVETPEGQNIGLISSLAIYARTNKYGFLETPYRVVKKGVVTNKIDYLSALEEGEYVIAQANAAINRDGKLTDAFVSCRRQGEFSLIQASEVQYMDISPYQIVSVAAALIPFLEHDDANRALMGSNMQRQAVPTMISTRPLVGTGMERRVASDSGAMVLANRAGVIADVDARRIVLRAKDSIADKSGVDIYPLIKYTRSNQDTCMNQRPLVKAGDVVNTGDVLADGPSTDMGELALGQNVLVAFMPWEGYNFEDSILISDRLVQDGCFMSIHIKELTCTVRDTKLGPEEITADIPNINESFLTKLDESGIIHIGASVKSGDILVGKITPKSEGQPTPEERLWRAIFREKATDVKDTSLRVPPGVEGTVIDVSFFTSAKDGEKDGRALEIEQQNIDKLRKDMSDRLRIYEDDIYRRMEELLVGKVSDGGPNGLKKGAKITLDYLQGMSRKLWKDIRMRAENISRKHEQMIAQLKEQEKEHKKMLKEQEERLRSDDDLQPGELKKVKVYIAVKRYIQPGDKLAGRHGNKGVISTIAPIEDMPYMGDGTPVDIVLNPLGVPSRMNIGQVLEVHLGWAAHALGKQVDEMLQEYRNKKKKVKDIRTLIDKIYEGSDKEKDIKKATEAEILEIASNIKQGVPMATPVFDGASESEIKEMLQLAGLPTTGKTTLYDGRTGDAFDNEVTVGYMHIMKLNHLVEDKMHARSTGPYSMVTQQPLGGKAKLGGQRFGEMEVWALEAYGAAYTLQEILTVKSDDVDGRSKVYKSIIDDNFSVEPNLPESFNVLVKEVRSLGINITCERDEG